MTAPDRDPLRRLVAAAARVCRLADAPDVFGEYHDSDELRALRRALADLDELLDEVAPVDPPPVDLPVPTVADVLAVLLALPGAPGVERLAGYLGADHVEETLRVALTMTDEDRQVTLLLALAPYLSPEQAERVLPAVPAMRRAFSQLLTLTALLPRLPEARRVNAVRFALATARRLGAAAADVLTRLAPWVAEEQRAELYEIASGAGDQPPHAAVWLAGHLSPEHRQSILVAVAGTGDGNRRAVLLRDLAPHLDESQLALAVAAAADIADPGFRARGLAGLARRLPEPRRSELVGLALAAAAEPGGPAHSYLAWDDLLPLLGPGQLDEALAVVGAVSDEYTRAHGIARLAPRLGPDQLSAALSVAMALNSPRARVIALVALVPGLPPGPRDAASAAAVAGLTANPGPGLSRELATLAPHLTAAQLAELWDAAVEAEREYPQGGLAALAPYVDHARRDRAVDVVLGYPPAHRADALAELAPHLTDEQRERALRTAREIGEPAERARLLAAVARHLSAGPADVTRQEALSAAARLRDPAARAHLLTELAPWMDGERRRLALAWAFAAAVAIAPDERGDGFDALTALVPLLDDSAPGADPPAAG